VNAKEYLDWVSAVAKAAALPYPWGDVQLRNTLMTFYHYQLADESANVMRIHSFADSGGPSHYNSISIAFVSGRAIIIGGHPVPHSGFISKPGYGRKWFIEHKQHHPLRLAASFFYKTWSIDTCKVNLLEFERDLRHNGVHLGDREMIAQADLVHDMLEDGSLWDSGLRGIKSSIQDCIPNAGDYEFGWDYDPSHTVTLYAIYMTVHRLLKERINE